MAVQSFHTTVKRIERMTDSVKRFYVRLDEPTTLAFLPGQFVIVNVPQPGGTTLKRAYSIASPPYVAGRCELCIQMVPNGRASAFFDALQGGEQVTITGPHGKFTLKQPLDYDPVFLSTGTGFAPFRAMVLQLLHDGCARDIWVFLGSRYEQNLLYLAEMQTLAAKHPNLKFHPSVSRPVSWTGDRGHIQDVFKQHITDYRGKEMYVCGWDTAVKGVCSDLAAWGVPKEQIHFEEWT